MYRKRGNLFKKDLANSNQSKCKTGRARGVYFCKSTKRAKKLKKADVNETYTNSQKITSAKEELTW